MPRAKPKLVTVTVMATPSLVEAALQLIAGAIEKQRGEHDVVALLKLPGSFDHLGRLEAARAAVEADGQRMLMRVVADQPLQQANREVVDCFPAEVLQLA